MLHFCALNKGDSGADDKHRNNESSNADCPRQQCVETATNRPSHVRIHRHKEQDAKTHQCDATKFVTTTLKDRLQHRRTAGASKLHFIGVNRFMAPQWPDLSVAA
jgi:hypothetical protein